MSRSKRKIDHIRYALEEDMINQSAFEDIKFIHCSLPNSKVADVRLDNKLGELLISSPLFINAMTGGGGEKTYRINKDLAMAAKRTGLAMAVGSQMAAIRDPQERKTYEIVRRENPDGIILANLGSEASPEHAKEAIDMVRADALQIHLNVIQELTMPEGDRDFTDALKRIERIVNQIQVPVIVKETGFGMSKETVSILSSIGVSYVDISGFGGTNFAKIENRRREHPFPFFDQWGIPTAISILEATHFFPTISVIGSGGIHSSLDIAKGLASGANAIGMAGPLLRILNQSGLEGLVSHIDKLHEELTFIMAALGALTIPELQKIPIMISGNTFHWLEQRGIDTKLYCSRK
ncbi:MAG: type 2 isopentenyl-diphosphate Delta-isomerase [Bacillota bacterium]|nr:type 2 isopentenyl-diphosphate Delta-isomerase [Bacillota bacterium]